MWNIKSFVCNPFQENSYILYNESGDCLIIDPGFYSDEERGSLRQFIDSKNLKPSLLLNTHCHIDHVFGNDFISKEYGLNLHMHPLEKPLLDHAPASGLMFNLPFDSYQGPIEHLSDGQQLFSGEDEIVVLLTPGHSPGSLSFYCPSQHFLISGDALFYRSVGRTDLPGGDFDTLIRSIREKLFVLPSQTRVYSGHGPQTTIGEESDENPFLQ